LRHRQATLLLYAFEGTTTDSYDPAPPNTLPGAACQVHVPDRFGRPGSTTVGGVETPLVDGDGYDYFYVKFVFGHEPLPATGGESCRHVLEPLRL